jgi:hypothetical protein
MISERRTLLLSAAVCLLIGAAAISQDSAKKGPDSPNAKGSVSSTDKKPALAQATRVSTDEAMRSAAQKQAKKATDEETPDKTPEPDVLEFRPAAKGAESSGGAVVVPQKDSKKSALSNVHGTVHGSLDPKGSGAQRTGASVGASSKSGKTAVYVETERGHAGQNPPR